MCFQHSGWMQLIHEFSTEIFDWWTLWIGTILFVEASGLDGIVWFIIGSVVSSFVRGNVLSTFEFDAVWCMNFSTEIFYPWSLWIGTVVFVHNFEFPRMKNYVEDFYGVVSILNFETRCSSSAASQIQWWVRTVLLVCENTGYDSMFGKLLLLFSLAWKAVEPTLKVGFICPFVVHSHWPYLFRRDNRGCTGLMLKHLQPIPDTEFLPFTHGNNASACVIMM